MKKFIIGLSFVSMFTTLAMAQNAEAYCWQWKTKYGHKTYYACYGPVQKLMTGYEDLNEAVDLVGCTNPSWKFQRGLVGYGKRNGAWVVCNNQELRSYDNSPQKIRNWVNRQ